MSRSFEQAVEALSRLAGDDSDIAEPILSAVPVSGVAVSTLGDLLGTGTVSASDGKIARVDELQFDLGEGPCWDALNFRRPVLQPDLVTSSPGTWPAFSRALEENTDVAALFAFPLLLGPLRIGAIDLYRTEPGELSEEHREQTLALATVVGRHVLRRALLVAGHEVHSSDDTRFSRRTVHQAIGFVIAQLGVAPDDAELLIQGQAYAEDRSMREIAEDILARRLSFTREETGIEESR